MCTSVSSIYIYSPKSPFIANSVAFVESAVSKPFGIAMNVACASRSASLRRISVSRTSTRTIVPFVVKTCFPRDNLPKIYPVVMPFMPIAFGNWPALTIDVPFVKRPWSARRVWQPHGKHGPETLPNIPCPQTCRYVIRFFVVCRVSDSWAIIILVDSHTHCTLIHFLMMFVAYCRHY